MHTHNYLYVYKNLPIFTCMYIQIYPYLHVCISKFTRSYLYAYQNESVFPYLPVCISIFTCTSTLTAEIFSKVSLFISKLNPSRSIVLLLMKWATLSFSMLRIRLLATCLFAPSPYDTVRELTLFIVSIAPNSFSLVLPVWKKLHKFDICIQWYLMVSKIELWQLPCHED